LSHCPGQPEEPGFQTDFSVSGWVGLNIKHFVPIIFLLRSSVTNTGFLNPFLVLILPYHPACAHLFQCGAAVGDPD
jgi:hypothetical protein